MLLVANPFLALATAWQTDTHLVSENLRTNAVPRGTVFWTHGFPPRVIQIGCVPLGRPTIYAKPCSKNIFTCIVGIYRIVWRPSAAPCCALITLLNQSVILGGHVRGHVKKSHKKRVTGARNTLHYFPFSTNMGLLWHGSFVPTISTKP